MAPRLRRVPSAVVELLRLCVVVFFAGLGYYVAEMLDDNGKPVLGRVQRARRSGVDPRVRARLRARRRPGPRHRHRRRAQAEAGLRDSSAEQIVAGVVGAVVGVLVAAGVTWPVLLLDQPLLTFPIFAFVLVDAGPARLPRSAAPGATLCSACSATGSGMAERRSPPRCRG